MSISGLKDLFIRKYRWLVCAVAFLAQALTFGFFTTFGSIFVAIVKEYGASESEAAWVGSIAYSLTLLLGSITSPLCSRIGCRRIACIGALMYGLGLFLSSFTNNIHLLYVTYGCIFAIGTSCTYFASILVLLQYFDRTLSNAVGIVTSGTGIGGLALGPLMEYFLRHFGIRTTFRLLSVLCIPLFAGGLLYERNRVKPVLPRGSVRINICNSSIWKNGAFVIFVLSICIIFFGYYIPYVHLVRLAMDIGIDAYSAVLLLGYISISQSMGKIIFGKVASHPKVNRLYVNQASLLAVSLAQTLCPLSTCYAHLIIYACVFGFFDGCFSTHLVLLIGDIVGKENLSAGIGALYTVSSLFTMLGPPFAGFLYSATGSYDVAFFVCGGALTLAICLQFLVPWFLPTRINQAFETVVIPLESNQAKVSGEKDDSQCSCDSGIVLGVEGWTDEYQDMISRQGDSRTLGMETTGASILSLFAANSGLPPRTTSVDVLYSLTGTTTPRTRDLDDNVIVDRITTV